MFPDLSQDSRALQVLYLIDDGLKFSGEKDVLGAGGVQLVPVLGQEVVGAAAAPIDDGFVLEIGSRLKPLVIRPRCIWYNVMSCRRINLGLTMPF